MKRIEITFKSGKSIEVDVIDAYVSRSGPETNNLARMVWGHPPGGRRWLGFLDVSEVVAVVELRPGKGFEVEEAGS